MTLRSPWLIVLLTVVAIVLPAVTAHHSQATANAPPAAMTDTTYRTTGGPSVPPQRAIGTPNTTTPGATTPDTLAARALPASPWRKITVAKVLPAQTNQADAISTDEDITRSLREVSAFYADVTDGRIQFQVATITDWLHLPDSTCHQYYDLMSAVVAETKWRRQPNHHLVVWVPTRAACPHNGQAELAYSPHDGGTAYVAGNEFPTGTIAHELGHNLGLPHSGGIKCDTARADDAFDGHQFTGNNGCVPLEYGDWYDIMGLSSTTGDSWGTLSPVHRRALGLDQPSQPALQHSALIAIPAVALTEAGSNRYPNITLPDGSQYVMEYRTAEGHNSFLNNLMVDRGVLIRRTLANKPSALPRTYSASGLLLQAGQQFNGNSRGISTAFLTDSMGVLRLSDNQATLKVVAMDDSRALVRLHITGTPVTPAAHTEVASAKAIPLQPTAAQPANPPGQVKTSARFTPARNTSPDRPQRSSKGAQQLGQ